MIREISSGASPIRKLVYNVGQAARVLWYTGHYAAGRRAMGPLTAPGDAPYAEEFGSLDRGRLRESFRALFEADWRNINAGVYKMPIELRRPPNPLSLVRASRDYLRDTQAVASRKAQRRHSEVLRDDTKEKYPRYYLQNFHYQSDGWLSEGSAQRYNMQVETLFTGAAGPMRRFALPFVCEALKSCDVAGARMLDIGCGAGSFIEDVKDNWPHLSVTALDLSPAYLGEAQARLGAWRDIEYREANAEETGLPDASFDIVTAVYLFHELPPKVRARVAKEIARLIKPGGVFILADTIQYGDEPGFDILLENFPRGFHEPYYDSYCRTDLAALFAEAGLVKKDERIGFLTKATQFERR